MPQEHRELGVVLGRRPLAGQWGGVAWRAVAVLPAAPPVPAGTPLGRIGEEDTFYGGSVGLQFHSGETDHYRDNLASGTPSVWVALRLKEDGAEIAFASADPYEGEGMTDGYDVVEAVPMPGEIVAALAAFVAEHHVERPFFKRKRDKVDPRKGGWRRPPGASDAGEDD